MTKMPIPKQTVPPLTEIALDALAAHPDEIMFCPGAEHLAIGLLYRVVTRGVLTYRLACIFRDSGHAPIKEAIESLDLFSSIPMHNCIGCHKGPV